MAESFLALAEEEPMHENIEYLNEIVTVVLPVEGVNQQLKTPEDQRVALLLSITDIGTEDFKDEGLYFEGGILGSENLLFGEEGIHIVDEEDEHHLAVALLPQELYVKHL